TANTTVGLYLRDMFRSIFRNVRLRNIGGTVVQCDFCVLVTLDNVIYSISEGHETGDEIPQTVRPTAGIVLDWDGTPDHISSANTLLTVMMEGVHGDGIRLDHAQNTYLFGGTSEHNYVGIRTTANSQFNQLYGIDVENNSPTDPIAHPQDIIEAGTMNQY